MQAPVIDMKRTGRRIYWLCKISGRSVRQIQNYLHICQTAHCGRRKPHFDFSEIASLIVPSDTQCSMLNFSFIAIPSATACSYTSRVMRNAASPQQCVCIANPCLSASFTKSSNSLLLQKGLATISVPLYGFSINAVSPAPVPSMNALREFNRNISLFI